MTTNDIKDSLVKVPAVTLGFWIIKILATTLGETGGDTLSMSMHLGYLLSTALLMSIFLIAVAMQIRTSRFHALLYWFAIIASTTVGTTLADFADRSLGIGYAGGAALLLALLCVCFCSWYWALGSINVASISTPRSEVFYWVTIMFSQTLGTALGDWTADSAGLGYQGAALIFATALALLLLFYCCTKTSRTALFWGAFVLTRPLGAALGDWLDKPLAAGGMDLSRPLASLALLSAIVLLIYLLPQRPATKTH